MKNIDNKSRYAENEFLILFSNHRFKYSNSFLSIAHSDGENALSKS